MENMNPESLLRKAQALGEDIKEMESIDVMGAYQQAQTQIKTNRRRSMYNQLMRYVAFLTIPLLLSSLILGYLYWGATDTEEKYAEVMAATGSVIRYELPDHSVVWLNSGSTLRYPTVFKKDNRNVELKGEAYFEVEADRKRPFYVNTPAGLSVYVYGTKFNVNAYEDDNSIETVLEKGKVNVISPDGKTTVQLAPGERLLYNKVDQKLLKGKVDVYEKVHAEITAAEGEIGLLSTKVTTVTDSVTGLEKEVETNTAEIKSAKGQISSSSKNVNTDIPVE